jgi:YD repeat-containing protein
MEFIYDRQGHITEQKETRSGKPVRVIKYNNEYDNAGRLISTTTGNTVTHYHYNSKDKIKEEIRTQNGTQVSVITYNYEYW